ncbi:hypothetical protein [Streptomyces sp. B21-083]|uniref:hypothetical protein n=1 Tax=Streptomyces sp. B21-083 TaxID=3039410 RepID=UPI002FF02109
MTSSHRAAHTPPPRRTVLLSISVLVTAALSACSAGADSGAEGSNQARAVASPSPKGAATPQEAAKALDTYEDVNSKANAVQDTELLGTVEAGQVHEQSLADYKQFKTWTKADQKEYEQPFAYGSRKYYTPAEQSWFAVKATSGASKSEALLIFDKDDGRFKMVAAVYAEENTAIPEIAVDRHGLATAVTPSTRVGTLAPSQLGAALADLFETGGRKLGSQLATTQVTKESVKYYTDRNKGKNSNWATTAYFSAEPAHSKVYALRMPNGGILAVFPTAHTSEVLLKPPYMGNHQINPSKAEAVYNSTPRAIITDEHQGQALATLTPSGNPSVIAREYRMVDSR